VELAIPMAGDRRQPESDAEREAVRAALADPGADVSFEQLRQVRYRPRR